MKRQEVPFSYEVFLRFIPRQDSIEQSFETKFDFDFQLHSAKKRLSMMWSILMCCLLLKSFYPAQVALTPSI